MEAAAASFKLVAGLGNPGARYALTRHNAGYWYIDRLAERLGARFSPDRRFHGQVASVALGARTLRLLKPETHMNHSGRSVQALAAYFGVAPDEMLVVHDELDLPPGTLRVKRGGGHGGHNGLRDVIAALSTREFWRLRIGIGHPGHRDEVVDYVLTRAGAAEQRAIDESVERALGATDLLLGGKLEQAMHLLHTEPRPEEPSDGL